MKEMPYNTLSQEQWLKAMAWIDEKKVKCEVCPPPSHQNAPPLPRTLLAIPKQLFTPVLFWEGQMAYGDCYPQFMAICMKCGNTKYFNAIQAKIIQLSQKEILANIQRMAQESQ